MAARAPVLQPTGDPGIVIFGKSMHVTYVNDRARQFIDWAGSPTGSLQPGSDLMFQIVKLAAGLRDRLSAERPPGSPPEAAQETLVSTDSGAFKIVVFPLPQEHLGSRERVMVIIQKCQPQRTTPGHMQQQSPEQAAACE